MPKFTPPLNARGIYTLRAPFPDITTKIYKCTAIRSLRDYVELGKSAFEEVYQPAGLTEADYTADLQEQANVITLTSEEFPTLYVPDTYISKYPDLEYVRYSNLVISASLGALPDDLDLTLLQQQVAGVISDVIGVMPVVRLHRYGGSGVVTMQQHQLNEASRQAAITNRLTDRARVIALQAEKAQLQQRIVDLEDALLTLSQTP